MADDRIKFATGAGVGRQITSDADAAIAMGKVSPSRLGAVGDRPAVGETRARRVRIWITQRLDPEPLERPRVFSWRLCRHSSRERLVAVVAAPLGDIIVLNPIDRRTFPIVAAR